SRTILLCPIYSRLVAHSTPECLCYTRRVPYVLRSNASRIRSGVKGWWRILAPSGFKASFTATHTEPIAPIRPPSPIPLAPSLVDASGVSTWSSTMSGIPVYAAWMLLFSEVVPREGAEFIGRAGHDRARRRPCCADHRGGQSSRGGGRKTLTNNTR